MALCQQMSLRLSDEQRDFIRLKMEQLRRDSDSPEKVTEAEAARHIIEEARLRNGPSDQEASA
ncbi:hypothetical protein DONNERLITTCHEN_00540 [Janthinobacterium phage vB_JliS-Donnerlittchen]|uniref:Uncharacterized protein n=1 Tax=Janthinobacterium phage vB_JliS-Donnerlittchen TaxID=2948610 RepID=A0A9E7SK17_9CAUD|nr:hypothetical protein P9A49_gp55 [Janthinobacterium phage vB_JliM-Donnerlittchen]USN14455.1 hypothetical protein DONNERLITTCHEN_00540 [Janthinobacterium phage vB_JliM-Donnerlittchen]